MADLPEPTVEAALPRSDERTGARASLLARLLLPLIPPLALLLMIGKHAVNVPRWDDWGLLPFVLAIREGRLTLSELWAQHNEHRLTAVKLILAPVVQVTDFDVTAMMYVGFALQLLAFAFLWRTLARSQPAGDGWLTAAAASAGGLLMFSPSQHEAWLWGLVSVQWHVCNLAAAGALWVFARCRSPLLALPIVFLLTCAGMTAVASGIALWGTALVVIASGALAARRWPRWPVVTAWAAGVLVLGLYFSGFRSTPRAADLTYFLRHPGGFLAFILVYIGWPVVQGSDPTWAGIAGAAGLVALGGTFYATLVRGVHTERILPWVWLSTHALLVAAVTAVGRVQTGLITATTVRYSTGAVLFWVGLLVVAALTVPECLRRARGRWRGGLALATAVAAVAAALNYARLYREGYWRFVQTRHDRLIGLVELWAYETAPEVALTLLFPPSAAQVRDMARVLEARRLGPFAAHMLGLRSTLSHLTATTTDVAEGEGHLQAAECTFIAGWAWDRLQPNTAVRVILYGDGVRLGSVPAYWYRHDLAQGGIGDGRHAFLFAPPARLKDGGVHFIRARIAGTNINLTGFPKRFVCSDAQSVMWR